MQRRYHEHFSSRHWLRPAGKAAPLWVYQLQQESLPSVSHCDSVSASAIVGLCTFIPRSTFDSQVIKMLNLMLSARPSLRRISRRPLNRYIPKSNKWQGRDGSQSRGGFTREHPEKKANSFVAQWQSEGNRYVGYENLVKLDSSLASFTTGRSKAEKIGLLSELTLTYFAR